MISSFAQNSESELLLSALEPFVAILVGTYHTNFEETFSSTLVRKLTEKITCENDMRLKSLRILQHKIADFFYLKKFGNRSSELAESLRGSKYDDRDCWQFSRSLVLKSAVENQMELSDIKVQPD